MAIPYFLLLLLAVIYLLTAAYSDLDFLVDRFTLGLPYGLLGWSLLGIINSGEPISFLVGFMVPTITINGLYVYIVSSNSFDDKYLFKKGVVTIPIPPEKAGEVKIDRDSSSDFIVARADDIIKPIPKGTTVRIVDTDNLTALVTTDDVVKVPKNTKSNLYNNFFRIIQFLTPKPKISGVCMVCFGGLVKSKTGVTCPNCEQVAHKDHLLNWLEIKGKCPNCKSQLVYQGNTLKLLNG